MQTEKTMAQTQLSHIELLNDIRRLRLIRNTTYELSRHTHMNLQNNGFNKKSDFIARCVYNEFCREAQERAKIDLDGLLADYRNATRFWRSICHTKLAETDAINEMLRCRFDPEHAGRVSPEIRKASERCAHCDVALLLLLSLKILPTYFSKAGDTGPDMLKSDLTRLRDRLIPLYENSPIFRFAPFLQMLYRSHMQRICDGELYTRLDLISFTQEVLANLRNNYSSEALYRANEASSRNKVHPAIEGLWTDAVECGTSVYWNFETLGEDYILTRIHVDTTLHRVTTARYEVLLYDDEDEGHTFTILRQSELEHLCHGEPIREDACLFGFFSFNDGRPDRLGFEFKTNRYDRIPTLFSRLPITTDELYRRTGVGDGWEFCCETGDYEYLHTECLFSSAYIYAECEREEDGKGGFRIVSWYRIPREELLQYADATTTRTRIRHEGRTYLCFIPLNRTFDVTDAGSRAACGIDIVKRIDVRYRTE